MRLAITAALLAAACSSRSPAPAADAGAGFSLTPPPSWKAVPASGPLAAAWEGPAYPNGFTPTMNVVPRAAPRLAPDAMYADWRKTVLDGLTRAYEQVDVVNEGRLEAAGQSGPLLVVFVSLPRPGQISLPLFAYAALIESGGKIYGLGALTAAQLDAATGKASPIGEEQILKAFSTFRAR